MGKLLSQKNKEFVDKAKTAIEAEMQIVANTSKFSFVPVDKGKLSKSIKVRKAKVRAKDISVAIVAGGQGIPYAVAVHEHLSPSSPPSWRGVTVRFNPSGRGPKFLEKPLRMAAGGMGKRIATRIKF